MRASTVKLRRIAAAHGLLAATDEETVSFDDDGIPLISMSVRHAISDIIAPYGLTIIRLPEQTSNDPQ